MNRVLVSPVMPALTMLLAIGAGFRTHGAAGAWPQWGGAEGQFLAQTRLPAVWSETTNVAWKTPLPGRGWSSPVIWGDQVWLTTAHETPAQPADIERRIKAKTSPDPVTVLEHVRLHALCLDRRNGRILYDVKVLEEHEPQWVHELNSFASPTPVIEEGRVYCHFGTFGTACLDTRTGAILWTNASLRIMHENGPGSSPILWRDHLIVHCDGSDAQYIVALNKHTGQLAWKTDRSGTMRDNGHLKKSYGTPLIVDVAGRPQLMSPAADWLYAYEPGTGRELWKLNYGAMGFSIVPRPLVGHGLLFMSTSFMRPELLAIRYEEAQGQTPPPIVWRCNRGVPQVPNPILIGDELYFISDAGGMVTCLEARTGAEIWKERVGGNHCAAPLAGDNKLYFCSREGATAVLTPGRTFRLLAKNTLPGRIMASPAAVDGSLFIRTDTALYRIEAEKP